MAAPHTVRIGNVEILVLTDAVAKAPCSLLFPALAADAWQPFAEHLDDDCTMLPITIPSFVVRSMGKTLLIDSGIGAKDRPMFPNGCLPDALAEAGIDPTGIDTVFATHIHIDHVGWHTTLRGEAYVPTFAHAKHVFVQEEYEYFTGPEQASRRENQYVRDCVLPLKDAADIELVDGEHKLTDELVLVSTPGHTPAHSSVVIMSGGEAGVIIGDVAHHPAQLIETGWSPIFDTNPALAAESREALVRRIEDERLLTIAGHFRFPGVGRVVRVDGKRTWRPG
jgi:glyoxylase-like metal-dependent hydrolase (beta-lactamase superfamily II)